MSSIITNNFSIPSRASDSVFFKPKAIIRGMHDFYIAMWAQSFRVWHMIVLAVTVVVVAAVAQPTRELLVGLNESSQRGQ